MDPDYSISLEEAAATKWSHEFRCELASCQGRRCFAPDVGISASNKPDGKVAKLLQVIRKPRKMAPVPLAVQRHIQTKITPERLSDNGAWSVEEIDKYKTVPTPWSTLNNDVARFLTVVERYTTV